MKNVSLLGVAIAAAFSSVVASASQVQQIRSDKTVVISQRSSGLWNIDDFICVLHDEKEVACGPVIGVTTDNAVVRMKFGENQVAVGDYAQLSADARAKGAANGPLAMGAQTIPKNVTLLHTFRNRLGATVEVGPNYLFPGAFYEVALDRRACLGVHGGMWAQAPTGMSVSGFGAIATLSYYREKCFVGPWIGLGLGGYFLTLGNNTISGVNTTALAGGVELGYSVRLSMHLLLELTGGARYVHHGALAEVNYPISQWLYFFRSGLSWQF